MKKHAFTLQFHIAGIFFTLVIALSFILIVFSYHNSKILHRELAQERTIQNAKQIKLSFNTLTAPILTAMDTLALSSFAQDFKDSKGVQWLSSINAIMLKNPDLLSIVLGYSDEKSVFIRSTQPEFMRTQFSTPQNSHIMIDVNTPEGEQTRTFFDHGLNSIDVENNRIEYRPTQRPWYRVAPDDQSIHMTAPYFYLFIGRMGVTLSRQLPGNHGVLSADITIASLSRFLTSLLNTKNSQLLLLDDNKNILAHSGFLPENLSSSPPVEDASQTLFSSPLKAMYNLTDWKESSTTVEHEGSRWSVSLLRIPFSENMGLWLAKAIPENELISNAITSRNKQIKISVFALIFSAVLLFWASKKIASPLKKLGEQTKKIRNFDFSSISIPKSHIVEVTELAGSVHLMSKTLQNFLETLHQVSNNSNFDSILGDIVLHCRNTANANYVFIWSNSAQNTEKYTLTAQHPNAKGYENIQLSAFLADLPLMDEAFQRQHFYSFPPSLKDIERGALPCELKQVWILPLYNRERDTVGYVLMGFDHETDEIQEEKLIFIRQFLGFASLIKENGDRILAQKHLFESFIEMMASAIDTKSPYTGGHCQRVPELTFMLAECVAKDTRYFPSFILNEKDREALYFAAWLHDCGKVTTPEYVVDKATKLDTIYNRIHEVRTRFEVLKRDAEIEYWKGRYKRKAKAPLDATLKEKWATLDDDFAFIAKNNIGREFMDEQTLARLKEIGAQTWSRTMDDSQGLSWEEEARRKLRGHFSLPCQESILSDRLDHLIPWGDAQRETFENWPFKLSVPALQYNRGELYNLSIQRGTLTAEERFIINDHIIQTIKMLKKLPYPKHLQHVPDIAGGHHEKLDGTGYPCGLDETSLSVDSRIMAIADIFEALTSSDRPYKKAKPLSEALKILAFMAKDKHIDARIFTLFIENKIYLQYAKRFLPLSQQDEVDEKALLEMSKVSKTKDKSKIKQA